MDKSVATIEVRVDLLDDKDYFKSVVRRLKYLRDTEKWGSDIKVSYDDSPKVAGRRTTISSIFDDIDDDEDTNEIRRPSFAERMRLRDARTSSEEVHRQTTSSIINTTQDAKEKLFSSHGDLVTSSGKVIDPTRNNPIRQVSIQSRNGIVDEKYDEFYSTIRGISTKTGYYPTCQQLADACGTTETTARNRLETLEQQGIVKILSRRPVFTYRLTDCILTVDENVVSGELASLEGRKYPTSRMKAMKAVIAEVNQYATENNVLPTKAIITNSVAEKIACSIFRPKHAIDDLINGGVLLSVNNCFITAPWIKCVNLNDTSCLNEI